MAQIKVTNAQYPLLFNTELGADDVGNEVVIDVQPGFVLLSAALAVRTAFDGTTPSVTIVDNKASPTTLIAATALTGVANAVAALGVQFTEYPSGGKIRILVTGTGTTTGRADVIVTGMVRGRQNERIGANIAT